MFNIIFYSPLGCQWYLFVWGNQMTLFKMVNEILSVCHKIYNMGDH